MRAKEFIVERGSMPKSHISAVSGMKSHDNLDNSSPYHPWRFASNFLPGADGKNPYAFDPQRDGPNGQALVTVGFTKEEDAMIKQAEKAFGWEAKHRTITPSGSKEQDDTYTISPLARPKKNKYGV